MQEADGGWTTSAAQQRLAPRVDHYWPPQLADGTPALNVVLVRLVGPATPPRDGQTLLFPRDVDLAEITLGELTAGERSGLQDGLSNWLEGYSYRTYDGTERTVSAFSAVASGYTADTTLRQVVCDVYRQMAHSTDRPRLAQAEEHNTEYLDDFSTDPFGASPRWTNELGTAVWDSTNQELDTDQGTANAGARYSANGPGSIEHEAQVTFRHDAAFPGSSGSENGGPSVRCESGGANDWYFTSLNTLDDLIELYRLNAGSRTTLTTAAVTVADLNFWTIRLAAQGGAGANVSLSLWWLDHGASKPSDPGWIGVDGSPDLTYTDTAAGRLDESTHEHCGIATRGTGVQVDTRHDDFKQRAISDRTGTTFDESVSFAVATGLTPAAQAMFGAGITYQAGATMSDAGQAQLQALLTLESQAALTRSAIATLLGTLQLTAAAGLTPASHLVLDLATAFDAAAGLTLSGALASGTFDELVAFQAAAGLDVDAGLLVSRVLALAASVGLTHSSQLAAQARLELAGVATLTPSAQAQLAAALALQLQADLAHISQHVAHGLVTLGVTAAQAQRASLTVEANLSLAVAALLVTASELVEAPVIQVLRFTAERMRHSGLTSDRMSGPMFTRERMLR